MVHAQKKITAVINPQYDLDHEFFGYLEIAEKNDIKSRLNIGMSCLVAFYEGEILKCFAVIDFEAAAVHVREMCGNFLKLGTKIAAFAEGLALHLHVPAVTFCTSRRAVERVARGLGYSPNTFGDFEKVII